MSFLLCPIGIILPTALDYLTVHFHGPEWIFGLSISAFSISNLFAGPILGFVYDRTRAVRAIVLVANLFEIGGEVHHTSTSTCPLLWACMYIAVSKVHMHCHLMCVELRHLSSSNGQDQLLCCVHVPNTFLMTLTPVAMLGTAWHEASLTECCHILWALNANPGGSRIASCSCPRQFSWLQQTGGISQHSLCQLSL